MHKYVIMGVQGCGKGTQAKMLVQDFDLVQLVTMPLFLFSATFYPLDVYPPLMQQLVKISPLYHGTELLRAFSFGVFDWSLVGHIAFLLIMGLVGSTIASRRLDGLLRT